MGTTEFTPEELEAASSAVSPAKVVAADEAVRLVAKRWEVHQTDLVTGRRRWARISAARRELWRLLYEMGWSYPEIARFTGRDHTSIIAGVKKAGGTSRKAPQHLTLARRGPSAGPPAGVRRGLETTKEKIG